MRVLLIAAVMSLHGCFFFYVPSSMWDSGNTCMAESAFTGQRVKHDDGRMGRVETVIGRSSRCQDGARPMLVDVKYD